MEKIYIIQPITEDNAEKYRVLQEEAVSLIESAGAAYAGTIYQNVREINPATFIGEGKLRELKERLYGLDEITVLFNGELSPSQTLNISAALDNRKVIDRTTLHSGYLCEKRAEQRRKITGRAGPAQIYLSASERQRRGAFASGRRRRHARTGRNAAGNRQALYSRPSEISRTTAQGNGKTAFASNGQTKKGRGENHRAGRIYKYGKIHIVEFAYGFGRLCKERIVCHA